MSTPWLDIARGEIGVSETPGPRATARIVEYFRAAGSDVKSDETAWCSAFMCWALEKAGLPSTNNLAARSWLKYGKPATCKVGAIAILPRGNSPWQGHVTLVDEVLPNGRFVGLGGNQKNKVCRSTYRVSNAIGFRWPNTVKNSGTIRASGVGGIATFMTAIAETTQEALPVAQDASTYIDWFKYVCIGLAIASFGVVIYRRLNKMKAPEAIEEGEE